uniref:NDH-dependent cyclic electron flow 5 n=1 Tax=Masdevallia picturata TaxID=125444 RepID=A0A0F7GZU6_9ASPA
METRSLCSLPNLLALRTSNPLNKSIKFPNIFNLKNQNQRDNFSLKSWAESLPSSPINVEYLEREFSGHGVAFEAIGEDCVIKMGLEEGSTANMVLPSGLITSYKPKMWHGGRVEVLHTLVSEDQNGEAIVQGGVSMDLKCFSNGGFVWSPATWALVDVRGRSDKFIQVELISTSPNGKMEAKCLVTLREDQISSELTFTNSTPYIIKLQGSILSHLTVSTPDATYAVGLQGSNYCYKQATATEYSIIPPTDLAKTETSSAFFRSLAQKGFDGLFSGWGAKKHQDEEKEDGEEREECNDYVQMNEKLSRIYTSTPVNFTVIDRGRRNSVVIQRIGFEELYMFSPGSDHNWYGKYAFVSVGPCALLKPIVLGSGGIWKGGQHLYNPNL